MRSVLLVVHTGRSDIRELARHVMARLVAADFEIRMSAGEAADLAKDATDDSQFGDVTILDGDHPADGTEVALVLGGDGTFLRAAEVTRGTSVPLLGVNLGHVGFLAETEVDALEATVACIVGGSYDVERRLTLRVRAEHAGEVIAEDWALNEASVEKGTREKMLDVAVSVDNRPLLRFGCDGVICATPTGSTAYAFSVGGPIIWPDVEALLVVPNAAHALFDRPLVIAPGSKILIELLPDGQPGVLSCDGRRSHELPAGSRLIIERDQPHILVARPHPTPFAERLVAKFQLPVRGFRDVGPITL
ncbi:MAG: kinase [Frankiales bacterium]|nr:kinase [Frankiales bacterium]